MNRVLKIVIYAVVLFLVYLWISSVAKSCNNRKGAASNDYSEEANPEITTDDEIYDEYFESEDRTIDDGLEPIKVDESATAFEEEDNEASSPSSNTTSQEDFSFEQEPKTNTSQRAQPSSPTRTSTSSNSGNNSGSFMVIAGSYLIKDNANKMVDRLKGLGYASAEIVNFDLSQYHSISAGRYSSYDKAAQVAREIKNKGIDCYVHSRK